MRSVFGIFLNSVSSWRHPFYTVHRTFLSEAFYCNNTWKKRLETPVLKKLNVEGMYYDLDSQFRKTRNLCAVDVDLFVNALTDDNYIIEVEELLHKFRQTAETKHILPTTSHAVMRLFLDSKRAEEIVRIWMDRLNYGIFPDNYSLLLLMDYFIKENDFKNAARVGCLQMFQEDYSHPLVRIFSLYSIHNYLLNPVSWEVAEPLQKEQTNDDEEEEIKIRVSYLRNPYFDDHFDLVDRFHICGKSLVMIAPYYDDALGRSYKGMGLALYNKWDRLETFLKKVLCDKQEPILYKEAVSFIAGIVNDKLSTDESRLESLKNVIEEISSHTLCADSMVNTVQKILIQLTTETEQNEIKEQEQRYTEWEKLREDELNRHLFEMEKSAKLKEIEKKKEEIAKREEHLFYFDNKDNIDLVVEKKSAILEYRSKYKSADSTAEEEEYVPPEVYKTYDQKQ